MAATRTKFPKRLVLHLGVVNQRYATGKRAVTTGDVAMILEATYGLFTRFWKFREKKIKAAVAQDLQGYFESLLMGRRVSMFGRSMGQVRTMYRDFISSRQAERVGMSGVPTQAALRGVSHRLMHPYAKSNPRRPSFRDTGLLSSSFTAWIETK